MNDRNPRPSLEQAIRDLGKRRVPSAFDERMLELLRQQPDVRREAVERDVQGLPLRTPSPRVDRHLRDSILQGHGSPLPRRAPSSPLTSRLFWLSAAAVALVCFSGFFYWNHQRRTQPASQPGMATRPAKPENTPTPQPTPAPLEQPEVATHTPKPEPKLPEPVVAKPEIAPTPEPAVTEPRREPSTDTPVIADTPTPVIPEEQPVEAGLALASAPVEVFRDGQQAWKFSGAVSHDAWVRIALPETVTLTFDNGLTADVTGPALWKIEQERRALRWHVALGTVELRTTLESSGMVTVQGPRGVFKPTRSGEYRVCVAQNHRSAEELFDAIADPGSSADADVAMRCMVIRGQATLLGDAKDAPWVLGSEESCLIANGKRQPIQCPVADGHFANLSHVYGELLASAQTQPAKKWAAFEDQCEHFLEEFSNTSRELSAQGMYLHAMVQQNKMRAAAKYGEAIIANESPATPGMERVYLFTGMACSHKTVNAPRKAEQYLDIAAASDLDPAVAASATALLAPLRVQPGRAAPDLTITDLAGVAHTLGGAGGKIVVLDFWSPSCAACQSDRPAFHKIVDKYYDKDRLLFLSINTSACPADCKQFEEYAATQESGWPHALGNQLMLSTYGIQTVPCRIVIHADGTFAAIDPTLSKLDKLLADELKRR